MAVFFLRLLSLLFVAFSLSHSVTVEVIDTHVHNSDLSIGLGYTYPDSFPDLAGKDWTLSEYEAASSAATSSASAHHSGAHPSWPGVTFASPKAVLMELEKSPNTDAAGLAEGQFYQEVFANASGSKVLGFVGGVRCESAPNELSAYLRALRKQSPAVRGVRQGIWKSNASFILSRNFTRGVCSLGAASLVFDVLAEASQLDLVFTLASRCPDTVFNLNHLGYPTVSDMSGFATWAKSMTRLASLPNMYAKLSGLPQASASTAWVEAGPAKAAELFLPYVNHTLAVFGAKRVNFAGNWFVLDQAKWAAQGAANGATFTPMFAAVIRAIEAAGASLADLQQIMAGTARRLYRL